MVVIRLQRKGFRNNPFWHIVVAPKKQNQKGKILEKVGVWAPEKFRNQEREIILNKDRIQYWIAQGALPTSKVQKFLSYMDIYPPPIIKFGSRTLYEKPVKDENQYEIGKYQNPYRLSHQMEYFLGHILKQEENSYYTRKQLMQNEAYKQLFLNADKTELLEFMDDNDKLQQEITKLKEDLKQAQLEGNNIGNKQDILVQRINQMFQTWKSNQEKEAFNNFILQQKDHKYKGYELTDKQLRNKLEVQALTERDQIMKDRNEQALFMAQVISQDEFKEYLISNGKFSDIKAETLTRQVFRKNKEQGIQVTRGDAYILCSDKEKVRISNALQFNNKTMEKDIYIPITKPVMPFPDLNTYRPDEHYEIPKIYDPIQDADKPYSLPNVTQDYIPQKKVVNFIPNKDIRGRRRPLKFMRPSKVNMFQEFSTSSNKFKYAWANCYETSKFIQDKKLFQNYLNSGKEEKF